MATKKEVYPIETIRHSTAHILAAAVMEMFPGTKLGIGPVIPNGFFYDFGLPRPLAPTDLPKLEKRMRQIIARGDAFVREEMPLSQAIEFFEKNGQPLKVELLRDLRDKGTTKVRLEEGQDVDAARPEVVSVYRTGKFIDLCRGPHVGTSKDIGVFRLTKLAGAYWRGSEKNSMLTRIYGLVFAQETELADFIKMMEEAERRDHRKLGAELDLFMISPEVGMGLPLWLPKGAFIRKQMEDFVRGLEEAAGYQYVYTPHIARKHLYETSGHWQHYRDSMYAPLDIEGEEYLLRPMNCPHHIEIYRHEQRSYRDLPFRIAEMGTVYRFEKSGELSGLTRVRGFTINDAHIFCSEEQIKKEVIAVMDLVKKVYSALGFKDYWIRLSLRDPRDIEKYVADPKMWDRAEEAMREALRARKAKYVSVEGEAAFYGPKIDFQFRDALGREFTASTVQLDFNLPEKFGLEYVGADGAKHRPVLIHRAPLGSVERVFAFLTEHYAGAFPVWLSPVQVQVIPVGLKHARAARTLGKELKSAGVRVVVDEGKETVGYKIRKAEKQKIPYMLVVGDKEAKGRTLTVRIRGKQKTVSMTRKAFIARVVKEAEKRK